MLISKQKPLEEILSYLEGDKSVFVVGCKGCAEGWGSGGEKQVEGMKATLQEKGKTVTGSVVIDMLCDTALTRLKLRAYRKEIAAADSILVLTDGSGVQTVAEVVNKVVHPGCNTLSSGGAHAEWKESERCLECGDCVLEFTGGLCPVARCSKLLLNGPCGGSQGGKCEVDASIPCVWQQIVDHLAKLGRLDKLEMLVAPKNWSVSLMAGPPIKRYP
jgi:hypothetical protein